MKKITAGEMYTMADKLLADSKKVPWEKDSKVVIEAAEMLNQLVKERLEIKEK